MRQRQSRADLVAELAETGLDLRTGTKASPIPQSSQTSTYLFKNPASSAALPRYGEWGIYVPLDDRGNYFGALIGLRAKSANTAKNRF